MLSVEATLRNIIDDPNTPGGALVSFLELAAYYRVSGALADHVRALSPGTRLRFTHDAECRIRGIDRYH
ncbi:MAG: hypothetical protein SFV20_01395 [Sphingopyxis sp.]|nr:hypothetical protein [Sphingopyxis sp.]